jgi:hypothetical protein
MLTGGVSGTMILLAGNNGKSDYSVATGTASGTCAIGETVKQATTLSTAVLSSLPGSSGPMYIGTPSGSPDSSHTWTGQTSGCTFAPSAAPARSGWSRIDGTPWDCYTLAITTGTYVDPSNAQHSNIPPCTEHATLTDVLDGAGISWKFYGVAGNQWDAIGAIAHICGPISGGACTGSSYTTHLVSPSSILTDISGNTLPQVSFVVNNIQNDHTGVLGGPAWVYSITSALQASTKYWVTEPTLILLTWGSSGGWYDYLAPTQNTAGALPYNSYGFRTGLVVSSPFTPAGTISNTQHDYGSVLRAIETNFGLGLINASSPYYVDAAALDLREFYQ